MKLIHVLWDPPFKTSANFYDFWPPPPIKCQRWNWMVIGPYGCLQTSFWNWSKYIRDQEIVQSHLCKMPFLKLKYRCHICTIKNIWSKQLIVASSFLSSESEECQSTDCGSPMKPFFHCNPELLRLGRQIRQTNYGVFSTKLSSPILESLVHVFHYSTIISTKN